MGYFILLLLLIAVLVKLSRIEKKLGRKKDV
ncbi:hypothetical protein PQC07_gp069 [Aeromonas phage D3]|uniref:Uncharacterized protein n=2 Tax=Ludhianavirus TaxID=3044751 RepID=A0A514TV81_9CAUD|nr:hypothetical protein PQC07_gp069 [Aeromonas phage D3]YP_010668954.1 hypothetical protein PQC08_gp069 [Aeromonas phage D6]QDJ96936.1 hypothetical protein D3_0206 [Aeromonas phage D3]QDJ97365.1 hypothetical protein D6_0206 [Aeromonas phage D6]QEP52242.1 hypothetical protein D9_0035 [Aeromonas phage D9]